MEDCVERIDIDPPCASYQIGSEFNPEEHDGSLKPTKWELFLAGENVFCCVQSKAAPCCACWFFFLLGYVFVAVFLAKAVVVGSDIFSFEPGTITSHEVVQRHYGFEAAFRSIDNGCDRFSATKAKAVCEAEDKCEWDKDARNRRNADGRGKCIEKELCPGAGPKPRERRMDVFMFVYEAKNSDQNILDDTQVKRIYDYERTLLTTANGAKEPWTNYCRRYYSNDTSWNCAAPTSMMNLMTMTTKGRGVVGTQAGGGLFGCMCSDSAATCPMCTADGNVKFPIPVNLIGCATTKMANAVQAADSNCSLGNSGGMDARFFMGLCKMMKSCQWSGPGFSQCSSNEYYYAAEDPGVVQGAEKVSQIDSLCDDSQPLYVGQRKAIFGVNFDCANKKSKYARTIYFSGSVNGGQQERDDFEENYIKAPGGWFEKQQKLEAEVEAASGGELRIMMLATPVFFSQMLAVLQADGLLSIVSLMTVFFYMWFALESMFLAACGIFEILFSLPVALSLWTVIMNQKITGLQVLTVYMILGIGADDVFILYDAWMQSSFQDPKISNHWVTRFCWAYRRSFSAMLITTTTTCGSFAIGATSPLPDVRAFCMFAAVVVLVDYLFCVSFFASAIIVYERYMKGWACCRLCGCKLSAPGKLGGPGCCWGACRAAVSLGGTNWKFTDKPAAAGERAPPRSLERFASGPLFRFLAGVGGKLLIVFWLLLAVGLAVSAGVQLRTAKEAPALGREFVDATKIIEVMLAEFPNFRQPTAYAVFGMNNMDPVEYAGTREDDKPKINGALELSTETGQMQLLALCRAADKGEDSKKTRCGSKECIIQGSAQASACSRDETVWKKTGVYKPAVDTCDPGRYCFIEEYARFWAYEYANCSKKMTSGACTGECEWDATLQVCHSPKDEFDYVGLPEAEFISGLRGATFAAYLENRKRVLSSAGRRDMATLYEKMTGLSVSSGKINFAFIGWNATYPMRNTVDEANEWYRRWQDFYNSHSSGLNGYQTTDLYLFMTTQNEMVKSAIMGMCLSLFVSIVVMLAATLNWWTTALGGVNLVLITTCFLGTMPLLGWSLGEYECIFTIAAVGLSVDYTLHLLHAYNHAPHALRRDRARAAMGEMGISVISSALTTMFAASVLFGCNFNFFFQFGGFIFIVILLSIVLSVFFLIPLMVILGPEHDQGKIPVPQITLCGKTIPTE